MKMIKRILTILMFVFLLASCNRLNTYTKMIYTMDTIVNVKLEATNEATANVHFTEIENIYEKYNNLADDYMSHSDIKSVYDINTNRTEVVADELIELLNYAISINKETNGYYEPLIGNISHLWKDYVLNVKKPEDGNIDFVLQSLDKELNNIKESKIVIEGNKVSIIGNANIDLGGIAKGFATEKVYQYLKKNNVRYYLVDAGSSNILLGEKSNNEDFNVGIKKKDSGYFEIIKAKNKAIGTSSYREQTKLIDGKRYTHLINAKTGKTIDNYFSLTLIGDDSAKLDAYTTALYAMSVEEIKEFLNYKNIDVIIYGEDGLIYSSLKD